MAPTPERIAQVADAKLTMLAQEHGANVLASAVEPGQEIPIADTAAMADIDRLSRRFGQEIGEYSLSPHTWVTNAWMDLKSPVWNKIGTSKLMDLLAEIAKMYRL